MHPDIIAYYERWDPEKLKKSQPVKAVNKNYDPREAKELNRSAYEAYLKRWGPEKLQKQLTTRLNKSGYSARKFNESTHKAFSKWLPKKTVEDILDDFGSNPKVFKGRTPKKPKGRKPTGKKLTPQKVKVDLWVGARGEGFTMVTDRREVEISLESKNKINRIAEILDKLNEKTPSGGYKYEKVKFNNINYFERKLSDFLRDATSKEIDEKMKQLSWEGLSTEYGYNGNIAAFAESLARIADEVFGVSLQDTANGSDIYNMEGLA